jgi:uncharacterized membrane protein|tara:strand:- start:832 stop:1473 length:642 start_codon:yes stop_codon:yes gene_type:complete
MKETKQRPRHWLRRKLGAQFLAGVLIIVPIGIALLIFVWIFSAIDGFLQPVIKAVWGRTVPGVGLGITIILIYLAGAIAENVIGRKVIRQGESLLAKVPIFRYLYTGIKQFLMSFSVSGRTGFTQVVLLEYPRKGIKAIGFITGEMSAENGEKLFSVFIPTTPNPTSGFLEIVREEDISRTDISVEDAMKLLVSAGAASSPKVQSTLAGTNWT